MLFMIGYIGADVLIYAVISAAVVLVVRKIATRKLYWRLVLALVIFIPTWDVVLSTIFFYVACPFVPQNVIYETAQTDGIYYEGSHHDTVLTYKNMQGDEFSIVVGSDFDLAHGYRYWEILANKLILDGRTGDIIQLSPPVIFRCSPLTTFPENFRNMRYLQNAGYSCSPVEEVRSEYIVKSDSFKVSQIEINVVKILDRTTGALMAEYRDLVNTEYGGWALAPLPFFNWLGYKANDNRYGGSCCPERLRYKDFQYDVLKAKNS